MMLVGQVEQKRVLGYKKENKRKEKGETEDLQKGSLVVLFYTSAHVPN